MKHSTDHILTTHCGSLARPDDLLEMMRAKDEGLDDGVPRTPKTSSPTTFRQWCEEVLKPAVLA